MAQDTSEASRGFTHASTPFRDNKQPDDRSTALTLMKIMVFWADDGDLYRNDNTYVMPAAAMPWKKNSRIVARIVSGVPISSTTLKPANIHMQHHIEIWYVRKSHRNVVVQYARMLTPDTSCWIRWIVRTRLSIHDNR